MESVLVIGERPEQAQALAERLGLCGVEAIPCARELKLAVRSITSNSVSVVLLDVDSRPETIDFFRLFHDLTDVPMVVRGTTSDREQLIWYLDNGAADYVSRITKPEVLAAKLQSLLRAVRPARPAKGTIRIGSVLIDLDDYLVSKDGITVALTPIEFRLLRVLAENIGRACSRNELLERVWGEDFKDCAHYLRLYMAYLRNKLEDNPRSPKILLTEWGYGYRLVEAEAGRRRGLRAAFRIATSG
ncbi:MAG: response regulator transcription factor [Dehalococcoidia bacterium]